MSSPEEAPTTTTMSSNPLPLTLIVAATRTMGIGRAGTLPWPPIKKEMAYFARVTKRVRFLSSDNGLSPDNGKSYPLAALGAQNSNSKRYINAVVMGRKTWESIPERFRPLRGRVNVVVSRSRGGERGRGVMGVGEGEEGPVVVGSLAKAVELLKRRYCFTAASSSSSGSGDGDSVPSSGKRLGRVFVIGGAQIYAAALQLPGCERILLTRIKKDFECDTFFPVTLEGEEGGEEGEVSGRGWVKRGIGELDRCVGEEVRGDEGGEGEVEWEVEMWEKEGV